MLDPALPRPRAACPGLAPPVAASDLGVYVHFPYCAKKCPYCDFNSHVVDHDDATYASAVLAELAGRAGDFEGFGPARSLFFGGGTPSLWAPEEVGRVIRGVRERLGLRDDAEITLEANPGTVAEWRFDAYVAAGVNRFSIGVQSFLSHELEALGRIHDGASAVRAVTAARKSGARVSLDLMYGLPGQTWDDVARSVDRALALGTHHLSAYTLTIEPDTVLGRQTRLGLFQPMEDDTQAELIERVTERLGAAGFLRYEISNYARPGFEAVHNSIYWVGGPYLGLGAGAHSYLPEPRLAGALRRENVKPPRDYVESALEGRFPARFEERLGPEAALGDRLMVAFRGAWGLDVRALAREADLAERLEPALAPALERFARMELLVEEGERWVPTMKGFLFNDGIARTLLEIAQAVPLRSSPP